MSDRVDEQPGDDRFDAELRKIAHAMVAGDDVSSSATTDLGEAPALAEIHDLSVRRHRPPANTGPTGQVARRRGLVVSVAAAVAVLVASASLLFVDRDPGQSLAAGGSTEPTQAVPAVASEGPQVTDHWHMPYGVFDCTIGESGKFLPAFDSREGEVGIHSHGDGLIHVHPFFESSAGANAMLQLFFDAMGIEVSDSEVVLDNGRRIAAGAQCADGSGPATIKIADWQTSFMAEEGAAPTDLHTSELGQVRLRNDRQTFTIAIVAEGSDIPSPPADRIALLDQVSPSIERVAGELAMSPLSGHYAVAVEGAGVPRSLDMWTVPVYDEPGGEPRQLVDVNEIDEVSTGYPLAHSNGGQPLVLRVLGESIDREWLRVQAPVRPNNSAIWVNRSDFAVYQTDNRIEIDLANAGQIQIVDGSDVLHEGPIVQGRDGRETPLGAGFLEAAIPVRFEPRFMGR